MSAKNDGGPAFPDDRFHNGMSLRDWFAGQAKVEGPIDESILEHFAGLIPTSGGQVGLFLWAAKARAGMQYALADAMLAERERGMK